MCSPHAPAPRTTAVFSLSLARPTAASIELAKTQDVLVEVPYYKATAQQTAHELVARKISASEEVDGLSIEGALESTGAGSDDGSARAAMSMGQAIYAGWLERQM